jgi:hypothetical protein
MLLFHLTPWILFSIITSSPLPARIWPQAGLAERELARCGSAAV